MHLHVGPREGRKALLDLHCLADQWIMEQFEEGYCHNRLFVKLDEISAVVLQMLLFFSGDVLLILQCYRCTECSFTDTESRDESDEMFLAIKPSCVG